MDDHALSAVSIYMRGIGPGRDASLRAIRASGLGINQIIDITPIPHNGVRPPKPKRG
ncbi:MAG: 30S ribosomal protein S11 [Microgenomates bacterium OLB22]|nr:MAG: 30S ribosomal protein S11 [Microgenomates bacterium OLB22]